MKKEEFDISVFLSEDELKMITGYKMGSKQKEFLDQNGIGYYMAGVPKKKIRVKRRDAEAFLK